MKRFQPLLFLLLLLGCSQEEKALLIPYQEPKAPEILLIQKLERNCQMPFTVQFVANVANEIGGEAYVWTINNQIYTTKSPQVLISDTGTYPVSLEVRNQIGQDYFETSITYITNSLPVVADFQLAAQNNNFRAPAKLFFEDRSQRATAVKWDFGDGYQSSLANPEHIYTNPGTYTVKFIAMCPADTQEKTYNLVIKPEPRVIRFDRLTLVSFPKNYIPENQDDNSTGADFYIRLRHNNFSYGISDEFLNRSRAPLTWDLPKHWNGDNKLFFVNFPDYILELWDKNDTQDAQVLIAQFNGNYLKTEYYPNVLEYVSGEMKFRVNMAYED